jgi:RNA polymerase sigma factor (sigma-70 family)
MATVIMALKDMNRLFGEGTLAGRPDAQLLERFILQRDEAAFAALVARHGPMVLGTCRAVLHDPDASEDAFQATFLVLVRKAGSIRGHEALGGWLHRVAYRAAIQANRAASRRRAEERKAAVMKALTTATTEMRDDFRALIHAEIERLPEALRLPVVLCDLEGLSREQAADELNWTEGTLRGRLARGRARLRARLVRCGAAPTAGAVTLALARESVAAVPTAWLTAAVRAAEAKTATATTAAILAERVIRAMFVGRLRTAAALVLTASTVALVSLVLIASRPGDKPPAPTIADGPNMLPPAVVPAAHIEKTEDSKEFVYSGRVVDPSGRPVAGAKLFVITSYKTDAKVPPRATTSQDGRFQFVVPRAEFEDPVYADYARVAASFEGFGIAASDSAEPDAGRELTLRLAEDFPIEGRVVDLEGRPVIGAAVTVMHVWTNPSGDLGPWIKELKKQDDQQNEVSLKHLKLRFPLLQKAPELVPATTTDSDGRFRVRGVGRERVAELKIEAPTIRVIQASVMSRHGGMFESLRIPQFPSVGKWTYHDARPQLVASPCRSIEGVVRDSKTGAPVAGATITSYRFADDKMGNNGLLTTRSDAQGRYRIVGMPRGSGNELAVIPPAGEPFLPSLELVADTPGLGPIAHDIELTRGVTVEGKIADERTGKPVRAWIAYHAAADNPNLHTVPGLRRFDHPAYTMRVETAVDGTYRLAALPGRGAISVETQTRDYPALDNGMFRSVSGFLPVLPNFFQAVREIDLPRGVERRHEDIKLDPGQAIDGTLLDPDGKPLVGAYVYGLENIGFWSYQPLPGASFRVIALRPSRIVDLSGLRQPGTLTEKMLRLVPKPPRTVVFQHDARKLAGAIAVGGDQSGPLSVRLQPWGVVEGRTVDSEGKALPNIGLEIQLPDSVRAGDGTIMHRPEHVRAGADGRFRIEGLAPGQRYRIFARSVPGQVTRSNVTLGPIKPGETRELGNFTIVFSDRGE